MNQRSDGHYGAKPANYHNDLEEFALALNSVVARAGDAVSKPIGNALSTGLEEFFASIWPAIEDIGPLMERLHEDVMKMFTPEWIAWFEGVPAAIREHERKYADIAIRLKWFVPHNLPFAVVSYFVEVSEHGHHEALTIQHLFLRHFRNNGCEELHKFVDAWRSLNVLPRAHWNTMRDCAQLMANHGVNRCNAAAVVIPAIIAVIEYLFVTFAREDLGLSEHEVKRYRNAEIRKALEAVTPHIAAFDKPARALAFDVLFERAFYGQIPSSSETFNRHKILHGESLRHGTAANALRAFFLVDFLVGAISEYRQHATEHPAPLCDLAASSN